MFKDVVGVERSLKILTKTEKRGSKKPQKQVHGLKR